MNKLMILSAAIILTFTGHSQSEISTSTSITINPHNKNTVEHISTTHKPNKQQADTPFDIIDSKVADKIYDTLDYIDQTFRKHNINYTISAGTQLGATRHGGLIPWDDDADIIILETDEEKIRRLAPEFEVAGFLLQEFFFGFKLSPKDYITIDAEGAYYPFVDIIIIYDDGTQYRYINKKPIFNKAGEDFWPIHPLPYGAMSRLVEVQFGHLQVRGLSDMDSKDHLDHHYGENWPIMAYQMWDHLNACMHERKDTPLTETPPLLHSKYK